MYQTLTFPNTLKFVKNRGIFADVIVYIFARLHTALRTEGKMFDQELVKIK